MTGTCTYRVVLMSPARLAISSDKMSTAPIVAGWDPLLHVAATIEEGWRSATDVLVEQPPFEPDIAV
jgi:hypothetical protein